MTPEATARQQIDDRLAQAGWVVQDMKQLNLGASPGVAVREFPTDIFYAQGVKANVVFFDNAPKDGRRHTQGVWFYDLRTNKHFTLKTRPLKLDDLQDFVACYHPENRHQRTESPRFKYFTCDALMARDKASLDIFWLKDDSLDNLDDLPPPDVLQQEIIEHLEAALLAFRDVAASLPKSTASVP
jgi:type I restriction enzyme M protein